MIDYITWTKDNTSEGKDLNYDKKQTICLYIENPSEAEIKGLSKSFGIKKEFFERYKRETRTVRYSMDPFIFVMIDYFVEKKAILQSNLFFIIRDNCIVIISPRKSDYYQVLFSSLKEKIKAEPATIKIADLFYEFINEDVKENYDVIDEIENKIKVIEDKAVYSTGSQHEIVKEIIKLKRFVLRLGKRFWASAKLISTIKKGLTPLIIDQETIRLFDDIFETYMHQIDVLNTNKEMITDILTIYTTSINNKLSETSNNLNLIMKKLTSLTVIIAVPTLLASIYGMNFRFMPELEHPLGYLYAVLIMLLSVISAYFFFHKKDWI